MQECTEQCHQEVVESIGKAPERQQRAEVNRIMTGTLLVSHPSNPAERFNRTLTHMLYTPEETQKSNWKQHLNKVVHATNAIMHKQTGFCPFFLLFGHEQTLPVDLKFSTKGQEDESPAGNAERWREAMHEANAVAIENVKKCARRRMTNYTAIELQDHILVRNLGHGRDQRWLWKAVQ